MFQVLAEGTKILTQQHHLRDKTQQPIGQHAKVNFHAPAVPMSDAISVKRRYCKLHHVQTNYNFEKCLDRHKERCLNRGYMKHILII
jgi:hypothetical protein